MNGMLSQSGQYWILNAISTKINSNGGVYIGLMSNTNVPNSTDQTPSGAGIIELNSTTCAGYSRVKCSGWNTITSPVAHLQGPEAVFTISSGSWENVYGYFVSFNNANSGVLWSELFPPDKGGLVASGNPIIVTPIYYQY